MIRAADEKDIDELERLGRLFHAESPFYRGIPYNPMDYRAFLRELLGDDSGRSRIFVSDTGAGLGGYLIAVINVFSFNFEKTYSCDNGFYVEPGRRGGGCFIKLEAAYNIWAIESGVNPDRVYLASSTGIESEKVYNMFEKMGYTAFGRSFRRSF